MNETFGQERAAQRAEVQVAPPIAEAMDDAVERGPWLDVHQAREPADDPDVSGREDVQPAEAAQQDHGRAPRAEAGQFGEQTERVGAAELQELCLGQVARLDGDGRAAERFRLPRAQATSPNRVQPGAGDRGGGWKRVALSTLVQHFLAEALDQAADDGDAGVE